MRFKKNVNDETRQYLLERLDKYECEIAITKPEREELHKWVSEGHDPYSCGCIWHNENGSEMDFVNSLRMDKDICEQMKSMTEKERAEFLEWNDSPSDSVKPECDTVPARLTGILV